MINRINELIDLIIYAGNAIKAFLLQKKKQQLKDAADESLDKKDTRIIETALGNDSHNSSTEYDGMYERPRKKDQP